MGLASAQEALVLTELEQLWIIPASKALIGANLELVAEGGASFGCGMRWLRFGIVLNTLCWIVLRRWIC